MKLMSLIMLLCAIVMAVFEEYRAMLGFLVFTLFFALGALTEQD